MKKLLLLWAIITSSIASFGQAPLQLNFQGAARNAQGNVIVNRNISVRLSVLSSLSPQVKDYSETRSVTTSIVGLFNVVIGSPGAMATTGSMAEVNWASGNKYLLLEIDPEGGNNFINLGTTQLQSVPFALNANTAAPVGIAGGDLAGNYPNPVIGDNKVTATKIANDAVTDSKIVSVSGIKVTGNIPGSSGNVTGIIKIVNGGTGARNAADARTNLGLGNVDNTSDLDKPISIATGHALNNKVNFADTAAIFAPYVSGIIAGLNLKLNIADTASMLNPYAAGINSKINITDTAAMLAPYASNFITTAGLNLKVNIADTAAMLSPYASNASTIAGLNLKVNIADTASMLSPYITGINSKINITDTAAMLAPYASNSITTAGLNLKVNIADTAAMLSLYASNASTTAGLNLKVNIADTASMLNPYAAAINSKINIADTATMLAPYASNLGTTAGLNLKVNIADTAAMLSPYASSALTIAGLNLKVNIADTAAMLNPYAAGINSKVNIADTASMLAPYASNSVTTAGLNLKVNIADTATMLNPYAAGINSKINITDTAAMLAPYASNSITTAGLNLKVNIADTAAMLSPYASDASTTAGLNLKVNIADTASMLNPYAAGINSKVSITDTAAMLSPYANNASTIAGLNLKVNIADTSAMLSPYASNASTISGLNLKVNIADTATMLAPYASNLGTAAGLNLKVNIADTAIMLNPYAAGINSKVNIADTATMLAPYASNLGTAAGLNLKVNIADTAIMLNPYAAGINSKMNIADTAAMLAPYASNSVTTAGLNLKVNIADTATMLNPYAAGINSKVNITDTAAMLAPYASNSGTSAGLNLKVNIADTATMLNPYASGINSKVNIADTAAMLAPYASNSGTTAGLNLKVNIADTATMLNPYASGINSKVNIADTSTMLSPYGAGINSKVNITDTTAMLAPYALGIAARPISSGSTNYSQKLNGSGVLVDTKVYDNGLNVGIGNINPTEKLDVLGNIKLSGEISNVDTTTGSTGLLWSNYRPINYGTAYSGRGVGMGLNSGYGLFPGINLSGRPNMVGNFFMYNANSNGSRVNSGEASFRFAGETHYEMLGGKNYFELHLPEVTTSTGTSYRPFSIYAGKDSTADGFIQSLIPRIEFYSGNANTGGYFASMGVNSTGAWATSLTAPNQNSGVVFQGSGSGGTTYINAQPAGQTLTFTRWATTILPTYTKIDSLYTNNLLLRTNGDLWDVFKSGNNREVIRASQSGASRSSGLGIDGEGSNYGASIYDNGTKAAIFENGGLIIGSGYMGNNAPGNGLIIEGNVGIGTTTPTVKLDVAGSLKIKKGNFILDQFQVNPPSVFTPATGSIVPAPNTQWVIISPVDTLAALTITLPNSPVDGQLVEYSFRQNITSLTVTAGIGGAGVDTIITASARSCVKWGYSGNLNRWVIR